MIANENAPASLAIESTTRLGERARLRPRVEVHEHFGVAVGLEDRPVADQPIADLVGVDDVAVVADADLAVHAVDDDRLRVGQLALAGGRVARVADGDMAGQRRERLLVEDVVDVAHLADRADAGAVRRRDAGALLPAMLQRVEAEIGELGGLGVAVDAEDAALLAELVEHGSSPGLNLAYRPRHPRFDRRRPRRFRVGDGDVDDPSPVHGDRDAIPAGPADHARRHVRARAPPRAAGSSRAGTADTTIRDADSPKSVACDRNGRRHVADRRDVHVDAAGARRNSIRPA